MRILCRSYSIPPIFVKTGFCPFAHFLSLLYIKYNFFFSRLIRNKSGKVGRKPAKPCISSLFRGQVCFQNRAFAHFFWPFFNFFSVIFRRCPNKTGHSPLFSDKVGHENHSSSTALFSDFSTSKRSGYRARSF